MQEFGRCGAEFFKYKQHNFQDKRHLQHHSRQVDFNLMIHKDEAQMVLTAFRNQNF
jgi:hypothetical protein